MRDNVDRRLLAGWTESRRHQGEARRFLARQSPSLVTDGPRALDEIVSAIADLERRRRADLAVPPPLQPAS